jgi:hypothetical protein
LTAAQLIDQSREHPPALGEIGAKVFGRWIDWMGR